MVDFEEHYPIIRTELWQGLSKEEVFRNICWKLDQEIASQSTIRGWFNRVQNGDTTLPYEILHFNYGLICAILGQHLNLNYAILYRANPPYSSELLLNDRILFSAYDDSSAFEVFDIFNEKSIKFQFQVQQRMNSIFSLVLINQDRILMKTWFDDERVFRLYLLEIDFETRTHSILHGIVRTEPCYRAVIDSLNNKQFALLSCDVDSTNTFLCKASVADDRIHIDEVQLEFGVLLYYCKIEGNNLSGFYLLEDESNFDFTCHFAEYDISTIPVRKVNEWQTIFSPNFQEEHLHCEYLWTTNKLYVAYRDFYQPTFSILVFGIETREWSATKFIGMDNIQSMQIDGDDILTVSTSEIYPIEQKLVYRLPMRKPDKLQNLAWAKIRRGAMFFGSDVYEKLLPKLPFNSEFRPLFNFD